MYSFFASMSSHVVYICIQRSYLNTDILTGKHNIIMQAAANALFISLIQVQIQTQPLYLGYVNNKHYVSSLPSTNKEINIKRKKCLQRRE